MKKKSKIIKVFGFFLSLTQSPWILTVKLFIIKKIFIILHYTVFIEHHSQQIGIFESWQYSRNNLSSNEFSSKNPENAMRASSGLS